MACADSTFTGNVYNIQIPVKVIPDIISHDTDLTYAGRGRGPMRMPVYIQMTGKLYDRADHGRTNEHIACKTRCHCFGGQRGKKPSQRSIADIGAGPELRPTTLVLEYFVQETIGEGGRSEEHTSELQSLMRISYAVFCLKKKNNTTTIQQIH